MIWFHIKPNISLKQYALKTSIDRNKLIFKSSSIYSSNKIIRPIFTDNFPRCVFFIYKDGNSINILINNMTFHFCLSRMFGFWFV